MLSGRNEKKMDYILASVRNGQNVLADKPLIIESSNSGPKRRQPWKRSRQSFTTP